MARAASELCQALAGLGHEVTVFTCSTAAAVSEERRGAVRVRRFPGPGWLGARLVPFARGIEEAIAAEAGTFDIAHLHGHRSGIVRQAAAALRRAGVGWVLQPHGTFPHHGQRRLAKAVWDAFGMEAVTRARALLALSGAEARDLPAPAVVVGSGVALPGGDQPLATATAASTRPRLLFVGSDAPQKRGRALVDLMRATPEADLDLVGPMGARFVAGFGAVAARVTVRGVLEDDALVAVLKAADLLLHPAVGEAFGMVPFEAALAGTGAVVADGHGCGEWFARAGGCVVPPDDPDRLGREVRRRIADPALGRAEAAAVAFFAGRELTWPQAALRVSAVYDTVVGGRATAPRAALAG
jgi:glycosyltransferase involved in cell wall biosynthesis